jgi:hypothetical protein
MEIVIRDDGQVIETITVPDPAPLILSKTGFQDLAWAHLGAGTTGMARFNVIMTACKGGDDVLQAVYDRYQAAQTFEKAKVDAFTQIMVAASVMTSGERTAILDNWPTE